MSKRKIKKNKKNNNQEKKQSNVLVRAGKNTSSMVVNGVKKFSEWRKARKKQKLKKQTTYKTTKDLEKELKEINKRIRFIKLSKDLKSRTDYLKALEAEM